MYKHAIHNTNAHSATRANTHSGRKTQKQTGGADEEYQAWGAKPGVYSVCHMLWPLGHTPYTAFGDNRRILIRPPRRKTQGSVTKTQCENFLAVPPPLAEVNYTRALEHTLTRMRVHTHTQHKLATQTRLYSINNSKQDINSITNLPMVPNTTKLKQNSTTTTEHNRTSRSSTQTNTSALTKALKRSKNKSASNKKPNIKKPDNTQTNTTVTQQNMTLWLKVNQN